MIVQPLARVRELVRRVFAETDRFTFDGRSMRYRDATTGRFISQAEITGLRDRLADEARSRLEDMGAAYRNAPTPQAAQRIIREAQRSTTLQFLSGRGGIYQMTDADWKVLAALNQEVEAVARQSQWYRDPDAVSEAQVRNRTGMLAQGTKAHSIGTASGALNGGEVPVHPGQGSPCMGNCRCHWEFEFETFGPVGQDDDTALVEARTYITAAYWIASGDDRVCAVCADRGVRYNPFIPEVAAYIGEG